MNSFQNEIYAWFSKNKRDLPWRKNPTPYHIWLSEIILQQTRVAQGTKYFNLFIERFPTINKLAFATENEVLKLWQGLGYYSRAINLHFTAKIIVKKYNGKFPDNYNEIIKLKGIGPYTAAAISSIAFNLPHSAVDGNIYRVLSRYFGIRTPIDSAKGKKEFLNIAEEIMFRKNPGMHNQALMEFGALQCVPKSPKCNLCPLVSSCYANSNGLVHELPKKLKKTKQSIRYFYFYYFDNGEYTYLEKRIANDIWKNLYQFPLNETKKELSEIEVINKGIPFDIKIDGNIKSLSPIKKHILSHQILYAQLIHVETKTIDYISTQFIRVNKKDISKFAVPKLLEQFIEVTNI
jgi:A/G-specific adenine glycosylase